MGQEQSNMNGATGKTALSAFCCNSSLCNNDSNIDNKVTEVNRRKQNRNIITYDNKSRENYSFNTIVTNEKNYNMYSKYQNTKQDQEQIFKSNDYDNDQQADYTLHNNSKGIF